MAQPPPVVRRVPVLLTALAAVVVLVAVLSAVGVLDAPTTASAALTQGGPGVTSDGSEAGGPADGSSGAGGEGGADAGEADGSGEQTGAGTTGFAVGDRLVAATTTLVNTLSQPADDAASPEPVDSAQVPAAPAADVDPAAVPADSGEGRRAVYSIHGQRVWLVEADGTLTRTYPVSGRLDRPGPGTYEVYSKSPTAISYDYSETMQYMIRFAHGERAAIGFHDIPVLKDGTEVQTVEQLGQPLSAGCIRQAEADAEFLWGWAEVGTTVVVVP